MLLPMFLSSQRPALHFYVIMCRQPYSFCAGTCFVVDIVVLGRICRGRVRGDLERIHELAAMSI